MEVTETPTSIQSVYEPGWGETGPTKIEDAVMIESPIGVYRLSEKRAANYQKALDKSEHRGKPKDIMFFTESDANGEERLEQAGIALQYAKDKLLDNDTFPSVQRKEEFPGGHYYIQESPVGAVPMSTEFTHTNRQSGVRIPVQNLVFYQSDLATEEQYTKGRRMLIDKANEVLQKFKADFRIPQFPPNDKLKEI
jgi:hypothetical protein